MVRTGSVGISPTVRAGRIVRRIFLIRGRRVMLDSDLAGLYGVKTSELNKAVSRNKDRFPPDFMFQLSAEEEKNLRFQFGISSWGGRRYLPRVFTEQGVAMLSGVLRSKRAVRANIAIMRAFVKLRRMVSAHKELAKRLDELERKTQSHDTQIRNIFQAIREIMSPSHEPGKRIGFRSRGS
ncbi:MAG: ORF6N domain-containing protein [Elusimicrobiota bacterium]